MSVPVESPILIVVSLVRDPVTGRVLMLRRHRAGGYDPWDLHWCLPGGPAGRGEHTEASAACSLFDETGIRATKFDLIGVANQAVGGSHVVAIAYRAAAWEGEPRLADPQNYDAFDWVDPARIPGRVVPASAEVLEWIREGRMR